VLGVDYELDSGVLLGLAYDYGFLNILKEDKSISQASEQRAASNASVRLSIGYNFAKLFT
jgi:opacity protein-like surface antigen